VIKNDLRLIFWETTNRCNLSCLHCRAEASPVASPEELTTVEMKKFVDAVAAFAKPILVLTGGEPLYRKDIFEIARYATDKGLRVALATNGTLIDAAVARKIKESGVMRVSISLDGATPENHDNFRMQKGSFYQALEGFQHLKKVGVSLQINTTVTTHNVDELPAIYNLVKSLGAEAFHLFLLVPVGCGLKIAREKTISPSRYEEVLNWFCQKERLGEMELKATCAPHYARISKQRGKGCLAASAVCFVSYRGDVQPCGYLPLPAGNIRRQNFEDIWTKSELFAKLRDPSQLKGKCGDCEYRVVCEGCRARAYAESGDYLEAEPYCTYIPQKRKELVYESKR
jgi:heme b synthase